MEEYKSQNNTSNAVSENMDALYEKAETDLLRAALKRSDKERFLMMTTLMKLNNTIKRAKITFTPYTLDK
jgi:hypothetical protein